MTKGRLEAFTDGVIAILITIMVLELKVPEEEGAELHALAPLAPVFLAYVLSFVYVGIYWNNHHHMMQSAHLVTGAVLWANHSLLFCLTLFPLMIRWIDEAGPTPWPVASRESVFPTSTRLPMAVAERFCLQLENSHDDFPGTNALELAGDLR